jgi:hypothetical protein
MSAVGAAGTFADMLAVAQPGDYVFKWSKQPISYAIEDITDQVVNGHEEQGPSHVFTLCKFPKYSDECYEMESVFIYGCRLLPASHYAKSADRMLLCRRKGATPDDIEKAIGAGLSVLGRQYEVTEELEIALNKIVPWHPFQKIHATYDKIFCSGDVEWMWLHTGVPFAPSKTGANLTPMQCMLDAATEHVFWAN